MIDNFWKAENEILIKLRRESLNQLLHVLENEKWSNVCSSVEGKVNRKEWRYVSRFTSSLSRPAVTTLQRCEKVKFRGFKLNVMSANFQKNKRVIFFCHEPKFRIFPIKKRSSILLTFEDFWRTCYILLAKIFKTKIVKLTHLMLKKPCC